jgi:hypothetical protein
VNDDRRRVRRRTLPFLRSAVLELPEQSHIVVLADLSVEGAFLTTRVPVDLPSPATGQTMRLRIVAPRHSREVSVPCELVWRSDRFDAASGRPAGIAVRFLELDPEMHHWIDEFALEGFRPSAVPTPAEHYEHRIIERAGVDEQELNRFGRDGWQLVTIVPSAVGFKLVLAKRI